MIFFLYFKNNKIWIFWNRCKKFPIWWKLYNPNLWIM